MKRIGIVTLYHRNYNYGGQLQAYAMRKVLDACGWEARAVAFEADKRAYFRQRFKDLSLKDTVTRAFGKVLFLAMRMDGSRKKAFQAKIWRFNQFMDDIPHTETFTEETISACGDEFDAFVCGSDQVWNPGWWNDFYLMRFTDKPRFAYAVSLGRLSLRDEDFARIRNGTEGYLGISVREQEAQRVLERKLAVPVEFCLDPTLLLRREDWETVAVPPLVTSKYILLYMIGDEMKLKGDIYRHCKRKGYEVVSIEFAKNTVQSFSDGKFCDFPALDAGPKEWLGWISNADYVFTDSFHGSVFSLIFRRKFWCLERQRPDDPKNENSRLYSLLSLAGLEDRLLKSDADLLNFERDAAIDFDDAERRLSPYRERSWAYISGCLGKAERNHA